VGSWLVPLKEKVKMLKHDLRVWNKDAFGDVKWEKQCLIKLIRNIDKRDDEGELEND